MPLGRASDSGSENVALAARYTAFPGDRAVGLLRLRVRRQRQNAKGTCTPMTEEYVSFDEYNDVLASADLLALVVPTLAETPSRWKWAIIATHSGLQGALVCAVQDTTATNVLKKDFAKAMLGWLREPLGDQPDHSRTLACASQEISGEISLRFIHRPTNGDLGRLHGISKQLHSFCPAGMGYRSSGTAEDHHGGPGFDRGCHEATSGDGSS